MLFRSDNGGEYVSAQFKRMCIEHGIRGRTGDAYAPQSQGIAEVFNYVIFSMVRTMYVQSRRPGKLWGLAACHSNEIRNIVPTSAQGMNMSPHEALFGTVPDVSDIPPVWGSLTFVFVPKPLRAGKLSPTGEPGYYVGSAQRRKGIQVYLPLKNKIVSTTSYKLYERNFSVVERTTKWVPGQIGNVLPAPAPTQQIEAPVLSSANSTEHTASSTALQGFHSTERVGAADSGAANENTDTQLPHSQTVGLDTTSNSRSEPISLDLPIEQTTTDEGARNSDRTETEAQRKEREKREMTRKLSRKLRDLVVAHDAQDDITTAAPLDSTEELERLRACMRQITERNTEGIGLDNAGEFNGRSTADHMTIEIPGGVNGCGNYLRRDTRAAGDSDVTISAAAGDGTHTAEAVGAGNSTVTDTTAAAEVTGNSTETGENDSSDSTDTAPPRRSARISARAASLAHEQEDEMARKEFRDKIYKVIEHIQEHERTGYSFSVKDFNWRTRRRADKVYKISEWLINRAKGRRPEQYKNTQASELVEPDGLRQAMDLPQQREWAGAILEELNSMEQEYVWELEEPPEGTKAIAAQWVFKLKRTKGGEVARFKARLVARGDQQKPGIDFFETYSATPRMLSLRIFFNLANFLDLDMHQMDIKTAFLHGEFTDGETVWMKPPVGVDAPPGTYCKLNKPIYGLRQAGRCWSKKLDSVLKECELVALNYAECVYMHRDKDDPKKITLLVVHVDDIITATNDPEYCNRLHQTLRDRFPVEDIGEPDMVLGLEVERDRERGVIKLGQQRLIRDLLEKFNMAECDPVATPMIEGCTLSAVPEPDEEEQRVMEQKPFRELVGGLNYLSTCSRADITLAVKEVARHCAKPTVAAWKAAKRILAYLKGTIDHKLVYKRECVEGVEPHTLEAYVDAD